MRHLLRLQPSCQQTRGLQSAKTSLRQGAASQPPFGRLQWEGMSWQTADLLSADTTDVLAANTTDVLAADTIHGMPANTAGGRMDGRADGPLPLVFSAYSSLILCFSSVYSQPIPRLSAYSPFINVYYLLSLCLLMLSLRSILC